MCPSLGLGEDTWVGSRQKHPHPSPLGFSLSEFPFSSPQTLYSLGPGAGAGSTKNTPAWHPALACSFPSGCCKGAVSRILLSRPVKKILCRCELLALRLGWITDLWLLQPGTFSTWLSPITWSEERFQVCVSDWVTLWWSWVLIPVFLCLFLCCLFVYSQEQMVSQALGLVCMYHSLPANRASLCVVIWPVLTQSY